MICESLGDPLTEEEGNNTIKPAANDGEFSDEMEKDDPEELRIIRNYFENEPQLRHALAQAIRHRDTFEMNANSTTDQ